MQLKFNENFASSSDVVTDFYWRQKKKVSSPKFEGHLYPNSIADQKKEFLHRNLVRYSAKIYDLLVLQPLFRIIIQTARRLL